MLETRNAPVIITVLLEASGCASNSDESYKCERNRDDKELNILTECTVSGNAGVRDMEGIGTYSLSDLEYRVKSGMLTASVEKFPKALLRAPSHAHARVAPLRDPF